MNTISRWVISFFEALGEFFLLLGTTVRWTFKKPFDRKNIVNQILAIGIDSLPIVLITALFTGMVMSLQTAFAIEAKIKGASAFVGSVVGLAMVKELGPVLCSVFLAGRVGSSIAAEIGSMKITDQIDALTMLSTSPIQYLVVPRFLALICVIPVLTIFADLIGVFGGAMVSVASLNVSMTRYWDAFTYAVHFKDIIHGLVKTFVFAGIIGIVSCQVGLKTSGGAEGVGHATTQAVVISSIAILIADYFLGLFLRFTIGI
jgi:phospholipid/cholesterol/gamma-HCH transport system permease protein